MPPMMLHRNNMGSPSPASPPWLAPEYVPTDVTDIELQETLSHGRPQGAATRFKVDEITCPMVTARASKSSEGTPVLFVHGLGHDMWDWTDCFERRPKDISFSALDLPGFGLSDKPDRDYPLSLLSRAVATAAAFEHKRSGHRPVVVGSSLGGHVAMLAALENPKAFAGLVLVSPGGLRSVGLATQMTARAYYSERSIRRRAERDVISNCRRIFRDRSVRSEELVARKLAVHRSSIRNQFAAPFARVVVDVLRRPLEDDLRKISPPVCLVFGSEDKVVPPAWCRTAAPHLGDSGQGAQVHELTGLGHLPMVENPDRFLQAVLPFVQRCNATQLDT